MHLSSLTALQLQWELAPDSTWFSDGLSNGMLIHIPPSSGSGSGSGSGGSAPPAPPAPPPPLLLSMLAQPPGAGCPLCPPPQERAEGHCYPPATPAGALAALGPFGLAQLQALDLSGASSVDELTELLATQCTGLQRLRLAGCTSLSDGCLGWLAEQLPALRELDVSGGWLRAPCAPALVASQCIAAASALPDAHLGSHAALPCCLASCPTLTAVMVCLACRPRCLLQGARAAW